MFDIIKSDNIIRSNFLSKLKTAARISKTDYLWIEFSDSDIDLAWIPDKHEKDFIHVFGSDLNHIQAIFANKDKIKQLDEFKDFKLHTTENSASKQNIIQVDEPITSELLIQLQEQQETEWMWVVNKYFDYSDIDFTWREDPWTDPKLYAYGNSEQGYKAYLLHKKTNVYGETQKREYKFKRVYDVINSNSVIRKTLLQKIKMAARITEMDHLYITNGYFDIDPYWEPDVGEKEFIHVFGSDLNHIQAIFVKKDKVKQLEEFKDFILHKIPNVDFKQDILEVIEPITSELLIQIQETQTSEWQWVVNKYFDYSDIDFTWREDPWTDPKLYAYGNSDQGYKAYLLHKKTDIYGETQHHEFKFKRLYDIIDSDSIVRSTLLQKIKTAARSSSESHFYLCYNEYLIDPYWEPPIGERDYIHVFGSDLNHIQAIFANKEVIKRLEEFKGFIHHEIPNINNKQNIIEVDEPITSELLTQLQEEQTTEWMWVVNKYFDYSEIDFTWREDPWTNPKLYAYGNSEQGYKAYLLHKKTEIYGETERKDYKFKRLYDVIDNNDVVRKTTLQKIKTAARISDNDYFYICSDKFNIDPYWEPAIGEKEFIHLFGSDLNHIQAIFAKKDIVKQLDEFKGYILQRIENVDIRQDIVEVDELITSELLTTLQESQKTEWMWVVNKYFDYSEIDFTWREDPWTTPKLYAYGNSEQGYKAYLLHKKTEIYGETERRDYKFNRIYDVIDSDSIIRNSLLQKIKTAARSSSADHFYICNSEFKIDPYWEPSVGEKDFIHVFGSDLNHIQAIFAKKDKVKQLEEFNDYILHKIPNVVSKQNIIEVDDPISSELLVKIQEEQTTEWMWVVNKYFDYSEIDFTWREDPWTNPKLYAYGNSEQGYKAYLLHKKTEIYGETEKREYKFNRIYDVIDNDSVVRKTFLQKIKTAARISNNDHFYICQESFKIDPYWEPSVGEKDFIHIFGSDLNHIQAIFAKTDKIKKLEEFEGYILHEIPNINFKQNIIEVDELISSELLTKLQEEQTTEWMWVVNKYFDYSEIDFTWRENPWTNPKLYAYGNSEQGYKAYLLHKKTDIYGETERREYKFNRVYDVINTDSIIRKTLIQKIKTAGRSSKQTYFYICNESFNIDPCWEPSVGEKDFIHVFGSDLNHIQAIFAKKDVVKQLDEFDGYILHEIPNVEFKQNIVEVDDFISSELLTALQEKQVTEWLWVVNKYFDYSDIDFTWRENPWTNPKLYAYGNAEQGYKAYLLHKKTEIYGETEKREYKFKRVYDVIDNDSVIRKTFMQKLKMASRISNNDYFYICNDSFEIDPYWEPVVGEKDFIHVFGSDLNHIQAVFAKQDKVKKLEEFEGYILHNIPTAATNQNIIEVDELISSELLAKLQEEQTTEWMWVVNKYFDYSDIDFTWRENPWTTPKLYAYGNSIQGYKAYLLHKKTDIYGETERRNYTFNRIYDVIDTDLIIRKNLLQKIKTASRSSTKDHFYISANEFNIDPCWEPAVGEKELIHIFGSDLNHIQAIFAKKDVVKQLDEFTNYKLHEITNIDLKQNIFKIDGVITNDIIKNLQENLDSEWMWVVEEKYNFGELDFNWRPDPWTDYNYYNFADKAFLVHKKANVDSPPDYIEKYVGHIYKFNFDIIDSESVIRKDLIQKIKTASRIATTKSFWLTFGDFKPDMYWEPFKEENQFIHIFGKDLNHIQAIFVNKAMAKDLTVFENYKEHTLETININNTIIRYDGMITPAVIKDAQSQNENEWIWVVDNNYEYDGFDFDWRPDPWNEYNWYNFGNKAFLIHKKARIDV